MKKTLYLTLFFAASVTASAQQVFDARGWKYLSPETKWVEKTMKDMSLEERIAQLMVVRVPLNMDDKQAKEFSDRMNGYGVAFAIGMDEHGQKVGYSRPSILGTYTNHYDEHGHKVGYSRGIVRNSAL